jgi:hypothetical protein
MKKIKTLIALLSMWLILLAPPALAAQNTIVGPVVGPQNMSALMTIINAALLTIQSCNSGNSAPINGPGGVAVPFQCWADTTGAPTSIIYKRYDGANWVAFGVLNATAHTWNSSIAANGLTLAMFPTIAANRVIGSIAGGTPIELTPIQATTLCNVFTTVLNGCVTAPGTVAAKFLRDDGTWQSVAGAGTVTSAAIAAGTGILATGTCTITTVGTCTIAIDKATAAQLEAGTSNKVLTADIVYTAETIITFSATPTFDFSTFINAVMIMTGNITSTTFTNIKAGQAGSIRFQQDGSGSRTLPATLNANFKFAGGLQPVLSTTPGAIDFIFYHCIVATYCAASLGKGFN